MIYTDEYIEYDWDRYQDFLDRNNLEDSDEARTDFIDLKIDHYLTYIEELGEEEYYGDEGDYEDLEIE